MPRARLRDERGSILITAALALPTLVLFLVFVVTFATWIVHKRHLQTQADAAALAGAQNMSCGTEPSTDPAVMSAVDGYVGKTYNAQVNGTEPNVKWLVNSKSYPDQPGKTDDLPSNHDCMVDVKVTEHDVAGIIGTHIAPFINGHARVEAFQVGSLAGALPIAVTDSVPKNAWVQFRDEAAGTDIGSPVALVQSTSNPQVWTTNATSLTAAGSRTGVRVILSGSSSSTCGDPSVSCFDAGTSPANQGLELIQGYSATPKASGAAPVVRSVWLTNASGPCSDPYFSVASSTCKMAVHAQVDFGTSTPSSVGAHVTVGGQDLVFNSGTQTWGSDTTAGTGLISLAPSAGAVNVNLGWEQQSGTIAGQTCTNKSSNPCKGTFSAVQRTFGASADRSGPIQTMQVLENGTPLNSAQIGTAHQVVVQISLQGGLVPGVKRTLYVGGQNQPGGIQCGQPNFKSDIVAGCPGFAVNPTDACPQTINGLPACAPVTTGNATNQTPAGLNTRILNDANTCTHPNLYVPGQTNYPGDPRLVQLVITNFGAFSGTGQNLIPVKSFASFYITGWGGSGGGFRNPCTGQGDESPDAGGSGVFIVGHYITHIVPSDQVTPGTNQCDPTVVYTCVNVLTR